MGTTMNYTRILILLVIWNLLPNCFPLPSAHRAEIDKLQSHMAAGTTTKEEIISILGKPDIATERYIFYIAREYDAGWWGWMGCGPVRWGYEYMDLYFEFDDHGTLTDYRKEITRQLGKNRIEEKEKQNFNMEKNKCYSDCYSKYSACINPDQQGHVNESICEEASQTCFQRCEVEHARSIEAMPDSVTVEDDCDPGMESCN